MANGMTSPGWLAVQFMRQIYELFSAFLRRIIAFFSACLYGCLSYVFIYRNLYNLPCPQVREEFFDRKNLNIVFPPLIHIIRDDYKSSVWIVLAKGAKPLQLIVLHLIGGFYFNAHSRITQNSIYLHTCSSSPIEEFTSTALVA